MSAEAISAAELDAARLILDRMGITPDDLMNGPRTAAPTFIADRAYTACANRADVRRRGTKAMILGNSDQDAHQRAKGSRGGRPTTFDPQIYKQRHAVERGINPAQTQPRHGHPL